ncbi:uncharacterized protein [Epargyreus clarus]|uniref:uncharacterized protein n=1 Tax=Epargyreus clarus TaxID=520877 RepID=UPI003C2F9813
MTAMPTPTSQAMLEWVKVFPAQMNENYISSGQFMKQLTIVAMSTITYLKNVFPEDSYNVETFAGIKLKILKEKCCDEVAQFLSTTLKQAFDAFDHKYLYQLALCFYENQCKVENLFEYHIFEYSYHDDRVTMNVHLKNRDNTKNSTKFTFENVRERTIYLIRTCVVVMQAYQNELPSTYDISLRLYYNKETPLDYQAPGFHHVEEAEDPLQSSLADSIKLGWVETPFHKVVTRSYIQDDAKASREAIASQNPPAMTQAELNSSNVSGRVLSTSGNEVRMLCPCNKYDRDELNQSPLLICECCGSAQHAACFGVRRAAAAAAAAGARAGGHACAACADAGRRPHADARLAPLSARKRECLCMFRRTLDWCTQVSTINGWGLVEKFSISEVNASRLLKLLYSQGIIAKNSETNLDLPHKIITDKLKSVMDKFFQNIEEEDNIVDRLLAETFASQENQSDPISEVLSPLEKVSLQNACNLGRVVDKPEKPKTGNEMEDPSLKEYRDAILSNDKVEELTNVNEALGRGHRKKFPKRKIGEGTSDGGSWPRVGVKRIRAKS